jgi:hypothetical protein
VPHLLEGKLIANQLGFLKAFARFVLELVETAALVGDARRFGSLFLADVLEPRSQSGEHRLLTLKPGKAHVDLLLARLDRLALSSRALFLRPNLLLRGRRSEHVLRNLCRRGGTAP